MKEIKVGDNELRKLKLLKLNDKIFQENKM